MNLEINNCDPKVETKENSEDAPNRIKSVKDRLQDPSSNSHTNRPKVSQPITYHGVQQAKQKLTQESSTPPPTLAKPKPKKFTPPREGVTTGVLENNPSERNPEVVVARNSSISVKEEDASLKLLAKSQQESREKFAKFREMEKSQTFDETTNGDVRNKQKDAIPVDTKSLRNKFLASNLEEDSKVKKINPSEEIIELYKRESITVYENEATESNADTPKSVDNQHSVSSKLSMSRSRAKELKEKFANYSVDSSTNKSGFKLDLGEGGIYESNPKERNDDIVPHQYENKIDIPSDSVKSNLQKFKELQTQQAKPYQKRNTEPIKLDLDLSRGGVYESTPTESAADSVASETFTNYRDDFKDKRYTNEARRAFLEKQKELEESDKKKKSPPKMINIWQDLCTYSGVFENEPQEPQTGVIRSNSLSNQGNIERKPSQTTTTTESVLTTEHNNTTTTMKT